MSKSIEGRLVKPRESGLHWLVVQTKPRLERAAIQHLEQRSVEPYCPLFLEPPWHPRAPRGPMPLFAGYIFVRCNPAVDLNAVRYCPAVLRPIMFGKRLATVDQELIDAIHEREADRGYLLPVEVEEGIPIGKTVRVMDGPMRGLEGVLEGYLRGRERAKVLMNFLRSRHSVEVDAEYLAVV
ncbi:MAG: hypothetical protein GY906_13165 [bacterium]|nr:hypothetical protein [bacterium]